MGINGIDIFSVITLLELFIILITLYIIKRWQKVLSFITLLLACGIAWYLAMVYPNTVRVTKLISGGPMMKAAIYDTDALHGVTFSTVPIPAMSQNQLLINVKAAGLNPSNYKIVSTSFPFYRWFATHYIGYDFAGIVLAVGQTEECTNHFKIGDEVFGLAHGSFQEYTAVFCTHAAQKSKKGSFEEAAGLPVVAVTSYIGYQRNKLRSGEDVLVIGASGGCGSTGVMIAKAMGAHVTGICSTRNIDFVQSIGAEHIVDYKQPNAVESINKKFDLIYDTVSSFAPEDPDYEPITRPFLKDGGRYVAINGYLFDWIRCFLDMAFRPFGISVQRPGYDLFLPHAATREHLEQLATWYDAGLLKVQLDGKYYLNSNEVLHDAFEKIKSRRTRGKIVFTIPPHSPTSK